MSTHSSWLEISLEFKKSNVFHFTKLKIFWRHSYRPHILLCLLRGSAQQELTLEGDLPAIRTTYPEVALFAKQLEDLVKRSIKTKKDILGNEVIPITYEIGSKDIKITHISIDDLLKDPRLPNPAYKFQIIKTAFNDSISFRIYFQDSFYSHYEITGSDFGLVETIQKHIDSFGNKNESFIGSLPSQIGFSLLVGVLTLIISAMVAVFIAVKWGNFLKKKEHRKGNPQSSDFSLASRLFPILAIPAALMSLYFLSSILPTWFSRTTIYPNTANIFELYSSEIAFISLLVGILGLVALFIPRHQISLPETNEDKLNEQLEAEPKKPVFKNQ